MKRRTVLGLTLSGSLSMLAGCASQSASGENWLPLFNGRDVNNWLRTGSPANWRVENGVLIADKLDGKDPSYLVTRESYGDFEIRSEFFIDSETNSGIFIRAQDPEKITAKSAYEVNIWDTRPDKTYGTGSIVDVAKVSPMPLAGGKWNTMIISARGPRMTVVLNGVQSSAASDGTHARGRIALQYGGPGVVKFRKVELKTLS